MGSVVLRVAQSLEDGVLGQGSMSLHSGVLMSTGKFKPMVTSLSKTSCTSIRVLFCIVTNALSRTAGVEKREISHSERKKDYD